MFNRQLSGDGVLGDSGFSWIPRQVLKSVLGAELRCLGGVSRGWLRSISVRGSPGCGRPSRLSEGLLHSDGLIALAELCWVHWF